MNREILINISKLMALIESLSKKVEAIEKIVNKLDINDKVLTKSEETIEFSLNQISN